MLNALYIRLSSGEEGASLVEYALIVLLIAILGFVAVDFFGESVSDTYSNIGSAMVGAGNQ